jgi:pyrimidine and pyridine-specific 5'-nucleotidase
MAFHAPSESSTRISRTASRTSISSSSTKTKPRRLSNASLSSSRSSVSRTSSVVLKTNGAERSPNATPVPLFTPSAKKLSSSIPALSATRRQSAPIQTNNILIPSNLSSSQSMGNSAPQPVRQNSMSAALPRPKFVGISRAARPLSLHQPLQESPTLVLPTSRTRVMSHTSSRPNSSIDLSSSSTIDPSPSQPALISKPSPSKSIPSKSSPQHTPSKNVTSSPQAPRMQAPRQGSGASHLVERKGTSWSPSNSIDRKTGRSVAISLSSVARQMGNDSSSVQLTLSPEDVNDVPAFSSVWDGDDMTLDLVTDVNESQIDEEVSMLYVISSFVNWLVDETSTG